MNFSRRDVLKIGLSTILVSVLPSFVAKGNIVINPEKFSLHEYTVESYSNGKLETFSEFMIHYGSPPENAFDDLFRHPIPKISKERLDCEDDRWEHTSPRIEGGESSFKTECMDMNNVPKIVKYVRLALNDDPKLMAIFYFRDNLKKYPKNYDGEDESAVIVFHFDLLKDKSYHLKQLEKLQNYIP